MHGCRRVSGWFSPAVTVIPITPFILLTSNPLKTPRSGQVSATYDEIIKNRIHKERDQYIESITGRICSLALAHHGGDDREFLQDLKKGSYNVCFFVRFLRRPRPAREPDAAPDGDRWVVRVPLAPCLAVD